MKKIIFITLVLLSVKPGYSFKPDKDSSLCSSPEAHQFDFWIGEWNIEQKIIQKDGSWLKTDAHTSVSPILGGCALEEHWTGSVKFFWQGMEDIKTMKGFSIRYYNPKEKVWLIHWMDNLELKFGSGARGNFKDGRGEFFAEKDTPNGKQFSRITFSGIKKNSVHWDLAISNDNKKSWTTIWIMEMRREKN